MMTRMICTVAAVLLSAPSAFCAMSDISLGHYMGKDRSGAPCFVSILKKNESANKPAESDSLKVSTTFTGNTVFTLINPPSHMGQSHDSSSVFVQSRNEHVFQNIVSFPSNQSWTLVALKLDPNGRPQDLEFEKVVRVLDGRVEWSRKGDVCRNLDLRSAR